MALVDHNALIGPYPFRRLPEPTPGRLLAEMDRLGIASAWVGHLPSAFYRDAAAGNDELFAALAPHHARLLPVPAVNPAYPGWEREVARAVDAGAPGVRTYPSHYAFDPAGPAMAALGAACGERGIELVLTVRFEDARQRHALDVAPELIGAAARAAVRSDPRVRLLVTAADRAFVEEVHFGSTPEESARVRWDVSWIWGPPEDHLARLFSTVGRERFVFGTHFPLRLPEAALTKLELSQ